MSNKDYYNHGGPNQCPPPGGQYYPPQGPPPQGGYYGGPQAPQQAYQPGGYGYQPQPPPQTVYVQGPKKSSSNDGCMACLAGICKCACREAEGRRNFMMRLRTFTECLCFQFCSFLRSSSFVAPRRCAVVTTQQTLS
ncbi:hypothetical protein BS47DRAFT_1184693 [Hydnum rufescens UP504]|uniref:Cysteine-rich transmembrane CYSTM domain-containing protein n=1 Tax=Hydnum rufescens UP504 TaxID=1448309 RepID=A0A9P6DQR5_9AGAM|nr:hypothetical protein BS47DRAFT_1184693 [Hydnum rufescens UP504]